MTGIASDIKRPTSGMCSSPNAGIQAMEEVVKSEKTGGVKKVEYLKYSGRVHHGGCEDIE